MLDWMAGLEMHFRQPRRVVALATFAAYVLLPTGALGAADPAHCKESGRMTSLCAKGQSALYVCVRNHPCDREASPRTEKSRFWLLRRLFI